MDFVEHTEIRATLEGRSQAQLELPTEGAIMSKWTCLGLLQRSTGKLDEF